MHITLNEQETRTLRRLLEDYLPELEIEISRTDMPARELRHALANRRDLCVRVLQEAQAAEEAAVQAD